MVANTTVASNKKQRIMKEAMVAAITLIRVSEREGDTTIEKVRINEDEVVEEG